MRILRRLFIGSHRAFVTTVVAGILILSGAATVGLGLLTRHHAPEPALSAPPSQTPFAATRPATPRVVGPVLATSVPLAISIPAIDVQSTLLELGRTAGGALEVPPVGPTYNKAGWYRYSPTPGAVGPAVITGHVDSAADGPSVFYRLGGLHQGDSVRISRTDGSVAVFTVDAVRRYSKAAFPTQLVYGNTNYAALRLITCGGPFDTATGHYADNIVVLASLTSS